jgi:hypothetical protein
MIITICKETLLHVNDYIHIVISYNYNDQILNCMDKDNYNVNYNKIYEGPPTRSECIYHKNNFR